MKKKIQRLIDKYMKISKHYDSVSVHEVMNDLANLKRL